MTTSIPSVKKPRSRRWRWLRRIGWFLLVLIIGTVIRETYRHYQVQSALDEALAELDRTDPGWRLEDIEAARAKIPDEQNSAPVVMRAGRIVPEDWPDAELKERFFHLPPAEELTLDDFLLLEHELNQLGPALELARKLAHFPRGRHRVVHLRNPLNTLLPHLLKVRDVVVLLQLDALYHAHRRDMCAAIVSHQAMLNTARSVGDEPLLVSQLVRISCVVCTCENVERTLAQGQPSPADLQVLQQALTSEETHQDLLVGMRGERATYHQLFDALESGEVHTGELGNGRHGRPSWNERVVGWRIRDNFRAEHPLMLQLMKQAIENVQLPLHEQKAAESRFEAKVRALPSHAILTRLLVPAVNKVAEGYRRKRTLLRCTIVVLAIERYRQHHGSWPNSLNVLVPEFLSAVPTDPFDGKPLRYKRLSESVLVYSVGPDERDDGGIMDRENANNPGTDVGCELWDPPHRRQPPVLVPAPPPDPNPMVPNP